MPNYQVWKEEVFFEKFCLNFLYWIALLNTNIDDAATFAGLKVISKGEKKKYICTYIFFHSHFHVKKNVVTNILIKVLMIKYTFNFQRTTTKIWINAYILLWIDLTKNSDFFFFQYWMLSKTGEIRRDEACLDFAGTDVILYPCHGSKGNQFWMYDHQVWNFFREINFTKKYTYIYINTNTYI